METKLVHSSKDPGGNFKLKPINNSEWGYGTSSFENQNIVHANDSGGGGGCCCCCCCCCCCSSGSADVEI